MHQIKFQSLIRGHHVYKNVCTLYKGQTLITQPDNSSNINEVIRTILNFFYSFFMKRFYTHKKHKMHKKHKDATKQKHKMETSGYATFFPLEDF